MSSTKKSSTYNDKTLSCLFLLIPTIMLIAGYFLFPYSETSLAYQLVFIPMYIGPIILLVGFLWRNKNQASKIKIIGWTVFSFFWSTQPSHLYFSEGGDIFNSTVSILGVYILMYFAYHEWLCLKRDEHIGCLNWIAGVASICGLIYYTMENTFFSSILIDIVADHSVKVLNFLTNSNYFVGFKDATGACVGNIDGSYVVTIIFACTAVQAMVLFVGLILSLSNVTVKKKIIGLLITLIPIYILNLLRNSMVIFLLGNNITSFDIAHNFLSKIGALITLIVLLFVVFKIIPELFDEIICLIDLPKRNGPIEQFFSKYFGRKKKT